tara:strand:+ start:16 stop:168 length:153 start_codon:yes stop_codon:yes gene_type:complete
MIDSLKTMGISVTGISVTWIEWLPVVVRVLVGLASFVYIIIKIYKELKNR